MELPNMFNGIYRGQVVDADDPMQKLRLKVNVPAVLGAVAAWAAPCVPAGATQVPGKGSGVWVMFEGGDPDQPVWMGTYP